MKNTKFSAKTLTFLTIAVLVFAAATKVSASNDHQVDGVKANIELSASSKNDTNNHGASVSSVAHEKDGEHQVSEVEKSNIETKHELEVDNDAKITISVSPSASPSVSPSTTITPIVTDTPSITTTPTATPSVSVTPEASATLTLQAQIQQLMEAIKKLLGAIHF